MPARILNEQFIKAGLVCPPDKGHIEYTDADRTGLYVEVRSTSPGQGTYWWRLKGENGKTARIKIGRTTSLSIKDAKARVKVLRAKRDLGENPLAGTGKEQSITWSDLFHNHYLPYKRSHNKTTIKNDVEMNGLRIEPLLGEIALNKISAVQVRQFHMDLKDSGLSPATADHHLKLIRHALNLAVDWDLMKTNPALKVKQFNQTKVITRALDPEELARLMRVLNSDKNKMVCHFLKLLLALGTRKSETLLSEWKHISRKSKTLFIPGGNSKSGRDRHVYLSDFALEVIDRLGTEGKYPFLFVSSRTGKRLTTVSKVWQRLRREAQLEDCRIHDLRRTHATILGEAGVNAMLIKDSLGHTSVTTSQIYVAPHDEARRNAANIAGHQLTAAVKVGTS